MARNSDYSELVCQERENGIANINRGEGRKLGVHLRLEIFDRIDHARASFLDKVHDEILFSVF